MTAHDHAEIVPGCFRCELAVDEAIAAATGPEVTAAVRRGAERLSGTYLLPKPSESELIHKARVTLDSALDVEEMAEVLVPVVYAQNQTHYEDSEGFMHVKPWDWLTPEFQESIRAEAREYVGYLRAAILGGDARLTRTTEEPTDG